MAEVGRVVVREGETRAHDTVFRPALLCFFAVACSVFLRGCVVATRFGGGVGL
jgi:hypothetical protein